MEPINYLTHDDFFHFRNQKHLEAACADSHDENQPVVSHVINAEFDGIYLEQMQFTAYNNHTLNINAFDNCVVSQWAVNGNYLSASDSEEFELHSRQSSLYYKSDAPIQFRFDAVTNGYFMFVAIPKAYFIQRFYDDNRFLDRFCSDMEKGNSMWAGRGIGVTPGMKNIIHEIDNNPYTGQLKKLYFESKVQELLLMQIGAFNSDVENTALQRKDMERIQEVRKYLEENLDSDKSIYNLARMVGINQNKLKRGFKQMFNHTIFGFVTDVRMQKAKHLLLEEKMFVNEVATLVGYKHPHHFAAAFKRKFGYLPGELRN